MFIPKSLKPALNSTTSLVGKALSVGALALSPISALALTVTGTRTTTAILGNGQSLVNSGTISDTNPAVLIDGVNANRITNTGLISGDATGILLVSSGSLLNGITNNGFIVGNDGIGYGIVAANNSEILNGIDNGSEEGNGSISGDDTGILITDSYVSGGINNNTPDSLITGGQTAIALFSDSTIDGGINNSGSIGGEGLAEYGIRLGSSSEVTGGLTNEAGAVISGNNTGLLLEGNSVIYDGISNNGTVGDDAAYIYGDQNGIVLNNSAVIGAEGGDDFGTAIVNSGNIVGGDNNGLTLVNGSMVLGGEGSDEEFAIDNSGVISGGDTGIFVSQSSIIGGLNNSGDIIGQTGNGVHLSDGAGITGGINNSGNIEGGNSGSANDNGITLFDGAGVTGGIYNTGTISGGDNSDGIYAVFNSTIDSITNDGGNISGDNIGIELDTSTITGSIDNSGTIDGGFTGISLSNSEISEGITNEGTIEGDDGLGDGSGIAAENGSTIESISNYEAADITGGEYGIYLSDSTISNGILNEDTVVDDNETTIYGGQTGIYLSSSDINVSDATGDAINNSGTIEGGNGVGIAAYNSSINAGGEGGYGINNSGTITGGDTGIFLGGEGGSTITGGINNTGNIYGYDEEAISLVSSSSITGGITNSVNGNITGGDTGIYLSSSSITGGINNHGTINGYDSYGIAAQDGSSIDSITNESTGQITGGYVGISLRTSEVTGAITNENLISGDATGILLVSSGSLLNGITNESGGTISGGSTGIALDDNSSITGGITNSGSINGVDGSGISLTDGSDIYGGILNNSEADISGGDYGIYLSSSGIDGGITNGASVDGTGITGGIAGISINDGSGIIAAGDGYAITNQNDGLISGGDTGIEVDSSFLLGGISNAGTIHGDDYGINVHDNSSIGGEGHEGILNSGEISGSTGIFIGGEGTSVTGGIDNTGSIDAGFTGIHIDSSASLTGGITNEDGASIVGNDGSDGYGIVISDNSSVTGGITNEDGASIIGGNVGGEGSVYGIGIVLSDSSLTGNIENSGNISGGSTGIYFYNSTADGIVNSGTIYGENNTGIFVNNTDINSITNQEGGNISGSDTGIHILNSEVDGNISNSGDIMADGTGIWLDNVGISGDIINNEDATISGDETGGTGISITSSSIDGSITNDGSITGGNTGIYIYDTTVSGGIVNTGDITGNAVGGDSSGIAIFGGSSIGGEGFGINNNSGTISGANGITIGGTDTVVSTIINSGDITGTSGDGIKVVSNADVAGGIENTETISGAENAISVVGANISGGIYNSGTIEGNVGGEGGNAIYMSGLSAGLHIELDGGHVIGDVIDDESYNGYSTVEVSDDFTTEGNFDVSDLVINEDKTLTISSDNSVTLDTMSDSTGGILQFGLVNADEHAMLTVGGEGGAINLTGVTVKALVTGSDLIDGDEIMVGDGDDTIIGGPGGTKTAIEDDSFLYDITMADGTAATDETDDTDLFLFITKHTYGENNDPIADALWGLNGDDNEIIQELLDSLNDASPEEQKKILESLHPVANGGSFNASSETAAAISKLVGIRLESLHEGAPVTGVAAGEMARDKTAWAQVFGKKANQDARNNVSGYDSKTYGFAFGMDKIVSDKAIVGLALGLSNTNIDSDDVNSSEINVSSYQISLYSDYTIAQDTFLSGNVGYIFGDNTAKRHDVGGLGLSAEGDYNSDTFVAEAKVGHDIKNGSGKFTPSLMTRYVNYGQDSYSESGTANALSLLSVSESDAELFEVGVGADYSWDITQSDGSVIRPIVRASYRHDLMDDNVGSSVATLSGGGTFTTTGINPADDTFSVGTGVRLISTKDWQFSADYDFEVKEDYSAHSGLLKAGYKF